MKNVQLKEQINALEVKSLHLLDKDYIQAKNCNDQERETNSKTYSKI